MDQVDPNHVWSGIDIQEIRDTLSPALQKADKNFMHALYRDLDKERFGRKIKRDAKVGETQIDMSKTILLAYPKELASAVVKALADWGEKEYLGKKALYQVSAVSSHGMLLAYIFVPINAPEDYIPQIHILKRAEEVPAEYGQPGSMLLATTKATLILGAVNSAAGSN